jgi:hypothetical protein
LLRKDIETMTQHAELVVRYRQLRQVGMKVNHRLVGSLTRDVIDRGAKNLGIFKKNRIELGTEDEVAVLMDYCIHDLRQQNVNAVERLLQASPPKSESDEFVFLHAMRKARYSVFAVEATEPGVGVEFRDLLRDEKLFVVDIGFSRSAVVGLVIATRIVAPEGIAMTTGTGLPVGVLSEVNRANLVQALLAIMPGHDVHQLTVDQTSELNGRIIRTCLEGGAAHRIRYADLESPTQPASRGASAPPPKQHLGRNSPCPCGSGKKFKVCCGARR